jgi:hypothetical protein
MFPLFDLALHGDNRNIRCKMQVTKKRKRALLRDGIL